MKLLSFTRTISFRIAIPVITVIALAYILFYLVILKDISGFAMRTIETMMDEMRRNIYEICDNSLNNLIEKGLVRDEKRLAITKAETTERIETFMLSNNLRGAILEDGLIISLSPELKQYDLKKNIPEKGLFLTELNGMSYYGTSVTFEPWKWKIFLFKPQHEFSFIINKIRLSYSITGLIFMNAIVFLFCLLHYYVHRPLRTIVKELKSGRSPEYQGTYEIEYLSNTIKDALESIKRETKLLDNIYHVAILRRGEDFFDEVVLTINRLYGLNSLIARLTPDGEYAEAISLLINGELQKGTRIYLKGTPCEDVINKKHMCVVERDAHRQFPEAKLLTSTKAESFIGIAVFNRKGEAIGIMNAFGKPMNFSEIDVKTFQTIGQMVGLEFDRLQQEKEKELIREQLFHAQKMEAIGTLAGGIAHDFNNMLQAILGYASLLKLQTPKEHPSYHALDVIERTSERAAELTRQLLGFARKGKYIIETLDINDLVNDVYKIISRTFEKTIEIRLHLSEDGLFVEGDKSQLTSVILNICLNAKDAMPEGGILIIETFKRKVSPEELIHPDARPIEYVGVSITDTGIGMDEEIMKHIFEPFFTTKEVGKGTGMGLAMVYGVLHNHGGFVTVDSSPGNGSRFIIYLPRVEAELKEGEKEMGEVLPEKAKGKIFIIEDDRAVRSFTKKTLEEIGYEVIEAADGIEAVEIYKNEKDTIDLVILDLILPRLNGLEVLKRIKDINPDQKIIISTGYGLKDHIQEIIERDDISVFLEKPYTYITLTSAIKKALYNYELDDD